MLRTRHHKRSLVGRVVTPLATMLVLGYFAFHAFSGQYGIRARIAFNAKETELATRHAALQAVRARIETRVRLLRDGTMERDMLDDRARHILNLVREDEIVLMVR